MKRVIFGMLMSICLTCVYAQNPVLEYDNSRDKVNLIDARSLNKEKNEQRKRIAAYTEELLKKDLYSHHAENQVDISGMPIGDWASPLPSESLRKQFADLIKNAKRTGGRMKAVYKVKGSDGKIKETWEWYDVYTTGQITPWITREVHEMWDKLPCSRKLKRFYMSESLWHRFNPDGLKKQVEDATKKAQLQRELSH